MRSGGDGVEGGAGLVHEDDLGLGGDGPGDAQPLLLAARQLRGRRLQPVLHLVPQGGLAQRLLDACRRGCPSCLAIRGPKATLS